MANQEGETVEVTLDDARDFFFTSLRACERYAKNLQALVDDLNKKTGQDAWLEVVNDECVKGLNFHQQQLTVWGDFGDKMTSYIDVVRKEADELAIDELSLNKVDEHGNPVPKKESKFVHPELAKFKLEKQAKILGKYGGVPAFGGMVLPRLGRDSNLRATASPAAVEINYSKVEGKETYELAKVMQFKTKKKEEEKAEWQKETFDKRRALTRAGAEEDEEALKRTTTISSAAAAPIAEELTGLLRQRQAQVEEAADAALAAEKAKPKNELADATAELAGKLHRRKQTLAAEQAAIEEAEKAAREAAEDFEPQPPVWSNPNAAFGNELAAALQRRARPSTSASTSADAEAPASSSSAPAPAAPTPPPISNARRTPFTPPSAGAADELAAILNRRKSSLKE